MSEVKNQRETIRPSKAKLEKRVLLEKSFEEAFKHFKLDYDEKLIEESALLMLHFMPLDNNIIYAPGIDESVSSHEKAAKMGMRYKKKKDFISAQDAFKAAAQLALIREKSKEDVKKHLAEYLDCKELTFKHEGLVRGWPYKMFMEHPEILIYVFEQHYRQVT